MNRLLSNPTTHKAFNYIGAYVSFIFFTVLGIFILFGIRSNVYAISSILKLHPQLIYILYSWGTYFLFIPYVLFLAFLEPYLNKAAKNGQVVGAIKKVLFIEGGLAVLTGLLVVILMSMGFPLRA
jgi:hypothetical protein